MLKKIVQHKVFRNFSYLTFGTVVSQILGLITVLKITKVLHPDDYGSYTFIMAQGTLLMYIGDLGIRNVFIRTIARDASKTNDMVYNGLILRSLAVTLLSIIYIGYNHILGSLNTIDLILVFAFAYISVFGKLFEMAYLGHQKMLPPAVINLIFATIWFLFVFIIPESWIEVFFLLVVFFALNAFKNLVFYLSLKKEKLLTGPIPNFWKSSKAVIKESWPYFAMMLIMLPFNKLSNNFLDINSTIEQVGYFNLSERFTGPVSIVLDLALTAIFPNLSALWITNQLQFRQVIQKGFKYYMLLGMTLCFLFTLFAGEILGLLFPASYAPAVIICQMQVWYFFLSSVDSLIGTILGATNNEKKILKLAIVNSSISTPILFYGSTFGALGLATAFVGTFALFQFYLWYTFKKTTSINVEDKILMWIFAIILFVMSNFFLQDNGLLIKILFGFFTLLIMSAYLFKDKILAYYLARKQSKTDKS